MTTIYEPLYQDGQELSEPAFLALRLANNAQPEWREVRILVDFYRRGDHKGPTKTGIFSPKFGLKTRVSGADFIEFTKSNADSDVCIINPFPTIPYYSFNVWMQGEVNHPGLTERAQNLLEACGIGWDLSAVPRNNYRNLCYSNFWVGTEKFWDGYVGGVLNPITAYLEQSPDDDVAKAVMGETWHSDAAPFLPFIVERLFSTYLSLHSEIQIAAYPLASRALEYCLTEYEREMVERMAPIIDMADASGTFSPELISIQETLCRLYVRYAHEHFASNAHPHTGRTIATE